MSFFLELLINANVISFIYELTVNVWIVWWIVEEGLSLNAFCILYIFSCIYPKLKRITKCHDLILKSLLDCLVVSYAHDLGDIFHSRLWNSCICLGSHRDTRSIRKKASQISFLWIIGKLQQHTLINGADQPYTTLHSFGFEIEFLLQLGLESCSTHITSINIAKNQIT